MSHFEALQEFESFYDVILPAQEKGEEAFVWLSGIHHPFFNAVMHLCSDGGLEKKVDAIIGQAPMGIPLSFWIHSQNRGQNLEKILEDRGFQGLISCSIMSWSTEPMDGEKIDMRIADLEAFNDLLAKAYQFDQVVKEQLLQVLRHEALENYMAYVNRKPIGACSLMHNGKVGGIFNEAIVATEYREKFAPMIKFLMGRAHDLGLTKLLVLSAPEFESEYSALGFKNLFNVEIFAQKFLRKNYNFALV